MKKQLNNTLESEFFDKISKYTKYKQEVKDSNNLQLGEVIKMIFSSAESMYLASEEIFKNNLDEFQEVYHNSKGDVDCKKCKHKGVNSEYLIDACMHPICFGVNKNGKKCWVRNPYDDNKKMKELLGDIYDLIGWQLYNIRYSWYCDIGSKILNCKGNCPLFEKKQFRLFRRRG